MNEFLITQLLDLRAMGERVVVAKVVKVRITKRMYFIIIDNPRREVKQTHKPRLGHFCTLVVVVFPGMELPRKLPWKLHYVLQRWMEAVMRALSCNISA